MNYRIHTSLSRNNKIIATKEAYRFFGILAMSICCLCCIRGTGGISCT